MPGCLVRLVVFFVAQAWVFFGFGGRLLVVSGLRFGGLHKYLKPLEQQSFQTFRASPSSPLGEIQIRNQKNQNTSLDFLKEH